MSLAFSICVLKTPLPPILWRVSVSESGRAPGTEHGDDHSAPSA
jgi:hypothetical protein